MGVIDARFSFYKAGQGSFYGGRIWSHDNDKVYTIVYDCGTSPFIAGNSQSLKKEIDLFKTDSIFPQHNNVIDLLLLSHLDYDHVSGLKRLLVDFTVKKIVLPYIEKEHRKFFLLSLGEGVTEDDLSPEDYTKFVETPHTFITENSSNKEIQLFFIGSDDESEIEYRTDGFNNDIIDIYPVGTPITKPEELEQLKNNLVNVYKNDLQFFIRQKWEFTTYVKGVDPGAIEALERCLKHKFQKNSNETLTFEDLKNIVTTDRKEAHRCYTQCIDEINSHGLILLHGPINFYYSSCDFFSDHELNRFYKNNFYYDQSDEIIYSQIPFLGTLLLGDTSLNPKNNAVNFQKAFKDKLRYVHIVQVPHHGSEKNWDYDEFKELQIGDDLDHLHQVLSVCNFGYGNRYGHPSHAVLKDLKYTIFLNSQFSRLYTTYYIGF
ncbi:MAG: MBL fold metallo-hydrolase [Bacteroidota bacterium]